MPAEPQELPDGAKSESGTTLFWIVLLLGVVVRLFFILTGVEVADVAHLHDVGGYFLSGKNPYGLPPFQSNFPPVALGLEVVAILLSQVSHVPFYIVFKLWPLAADVGTGLLLFRLLQSTGQSSRRAAIWAGVFLLNPISVLVTAAHGQLDPVTNFLSLLALAFLVWNPKRWFGLSAASLGFAIAIKPNPALLLPIFATARGLSLRQRALYVVIACLPTGVTLAPFFIDNPNGVMGNVFTYAGEYDFGYAAVLRGAWLLKTGSTWLPGTVGDDITHAARLTFVAAYLMLLALGIGRLRLAQLVTIVYLLFQTLFSGLSAQYTVWIIPFAVLAGEPFVLGYTVATTASLLGFYLYFWPSILLGRLNAFDAFRPDFAPIYFVGMLFAWVTNATWLVQTVWARRRLLRFEISDASDLSRPGALRSLAALAGALAFLVSLVPIVRLIQFMVTALQKPVV
jgi:hypothetical protein